MRARSVDKNVARQIDVVSGTGGLAYGNTWANVSSYGLHWHPFNPDVPADIVTPSYQSVNNVSVGWTAGGGGEWMFLPNWSVKAEAIYYNLGSQNVTGQYSPLLNERYTYSPYAFIAAARTNVSYNGIIARAGLNYHFNLALLWQNFEKSSIFGIPLDHFA